MGNPQGLILALDFGGTKLTASTTRAGQRTWLTIRRTFSPPGADAHSDYETMLQLARDALEQPRGMLAAIGVSFGGPVDAREGLVLLSHHVPGWEQMPLRDRLQQEFGVPVAVDNDANAAALGEWRFGAGQGCDSLFYVTVSTGVGGGWVLEGKIHHGADRMAGEIGHMVIKPDGPQCVCGRRGCLETLACGPAIARTARELLAEDNTVGLRLRALVDGDPQIITARHVGQAALDGDAVAQRVLRDAGRALGTGLATAIVLMNPCRVVLGGGVINLGEQYLEDVRVAAQSSVLAGMTVAIVPATLGDDAPLWGAVALAEDLLARRGV